MYFGSVKFFKHLIMAVLALLIIIPTVICIVQSVQLGEKDAEISELKEEIGALKLGGNQSRYNANELFNIYKLSLEEKDDFLSLLYDYNKIAYLKAAGITPTDGTNTGSNTLTAAPVTSPSSGSNSSSVSTTTPPEPDAPAYTQLFPELYAEGTSDIVYNTDMDYVYLTFDDGPSKYTENILYYLDLYDIKATFFVIPDGTAECNARLQKIANAGHTIGVHTASHDYEKIYASVDAYLTDFELAYNRIYEATGIKAQLFRFPGGSINDYNTEIRDELIEEMTRRGFIYFDWNVDSNDAMGATWTEMYNSVLKDTAATNRAVILMHDYNGGYGTVLVLEDIIRALINDSRGYKLDKLTVNVKPVQF